MINVKQKMFLARMANHGLRAIRRPLGLNMCTQCSRKGIIWNLDLDEGIDLCIYLLGAYEPRALRSYSSLIQARDIVFDIGANIGAHTFHFAKLVGPHGRVFAFEPTDYCTSKFSKNAALNPELSRRIHFRQCFLAAHASDSRPATVSSRWPVANQHNDLHIEHLGKPERLDNAFSATADEICRIERLQRLDFVKIDVDGFEGQVLHGFLETLEHFRPIIMIELAPFLFKKANVSDFDKFVDFVARLSYRFTEANSGRDISSNPIEIRSTIPPGGSMNCILFPIAAGRKGRNLS